MLVFWYCGFGFLNFFFPEIYLSLLLSILCMILWLQHFIICKDLFLQLRNVNMGWTHAYKKLYFCQWNNHPPIFMFTRLAFVLVSLLFHPDLHSIAFLQAVFSGCWSNLCACVDLDILFITNCYLVQSSELVGAFSSLFKQTERGLKSIKNASLWETK